MTGYNYETDFVPVVAHPASTASYHSGNGPQTAGHGIYDTVSFDSVPANALFIAFKWVYNTSFYSCCIDNVEVTSDGPYCAVPTATVSNLGYNHATLNIIGSANEYQANIKLATDANFNDANDVTVNGVTYDFTNLAPATNYQYRVRAICDTDMISDWYVGTFVTDSLPCLVPEDLHTTNVGYTTATLAWTAAEGQSQWGVRVWNSASEQELVATSNPYTVTGLTKATQYYAVVNAICGDGTVESEYSDTITFTTMDCDQTVTGVAVSNITATSAVVSWNNAGVDTYEVDYGPRGHGQGQGTTVLVNNATTYTITSGLAAESNYSVYVRVVCEQGVNGPWSPAVEFSTPAVGIEVADGMNISIYPNPTSSSTTIALSGVSGEVAITIVDMNGRVVKSDSMSCEGDCVKTMEVSGLAQGAYFVRVNGENVNMVKKLVVK